MGLLDQVLGGVLGGGGGMGRRRAGGRSPMANAVMVALAAAALQQYLRQRNQNQAGGQVGAAPGAQSGGLGGGGGLGDVLGGVLGGSGGAGGLGGLGGLGGILGSLGGAGGLGGLLEQMNRRGLGGQAQSWVNIGANQPINPEDVAQALDDDDIDQIAEETGVPREEVLAEVARALPEAINELTPNGRLPTDAELSELAALLDIEASSQTPRPGAPPAG